MRRHFATLIALTTGWAALAVVVFVVALSNVARSCGVPALDARFTWSAADAAELLDGCAAEGRAAYGFRHGVDVVYPAVLVGWTLFFGSAVEHPRLGAGLGTIPVVAALSDYGENLCVRRLLTGPFDPDVADLGGRLAVVKNLGSTLSFVIVAALAVWWWRCRSPGVDIG